MLPKFDELRKVDITPYVEKRDGMDYLNWAKCIDLLHEYGAEKVYFEPIPNPSTGSTLYCSDREFVDKSGNANKCYETAIKVVVDDNEWVFRGAVTNGSNPVKDNSMNQQRLWNCQTRLFVKCIAIHTGLGFGLWIKEELQAPKDSMDDLARHSIGAIKERIQQEITSKMDKDLDVEKIAVECGLRDAEEMRNLLRQLKYIDDFEKRLQQL